MEKRPGVISLEGRGDASFSYAITRKKLDLDFENKKEEFKKLMRDVNLGIVGKDYTAKDPGSIVFHFLPTMGKQEIYRHLPYKVSLPLVYNTNVYIYDAFSCLGDKFNLMDLNVFVELKYSDMSCGIIWAEIYYVADCIIPAMIIRPKFIHL